MLLQTIHRIAEVVSGEVEEYRRRVRELEAKLTEAEEQHRQQVEAAAQEAERRVAAKEQECLNTISTAYGTRLIKVLSFMCTDFLGCISYCIKFGCFECTLFIFVSCLYCDCYLSG